jgi:hypothetical protein
MRESMLGFDVVFVLLIAVGNLLGRNNPLLSINNIHYKSL